MKKNNKGRKQAGLKQNNSNLYLGIEDYLNNVIKTINNINIKDLEKFSKIILETYENDRNIYIFGNGGSGANASHFRGDFVKGVSCALDKKFKVTCLNENIPTIMAIANDISYDDIFIEQLKNFIKANDLVIGISGSGNSKNIIKALEYANSIGAITIAICGFDGGESKKLADFAIHINVNDMEISEDLHLMIMHSIKRVIMNHLKNKKTSPILEKLGSINL